jgi:predicted nucleotidyltransferase
VKESTQYLKIVEWSDEDQCFIGPTGKMLRKLQVMLNINRYEPEIKRLCKFLSVKSLYLVGSATRNDFTENSDVDILFEFQGDENRFNRYFTLKEQLEELFDRKVDLIEEEAVNNPYVKRNLQKDRVLVYAA